MTEDVRRTQAGQDAGKKESLPSEPHTSPRERMSLDSAREVLTTIVATHEDLLTEASDLSTVGVYDLAHIREAFLCVADNLYQTGNGRNMGNSVNKTEKQTPYGQLSLQVFRQLNDYEPGEPESLKMTLREDSGMNVIESQIPLRDDVSGLMKKGTKFADLRNGEETTISDLEDEFTIEKYRKIWKGIRWMSANMLSWHEEFLRPEDLDTFFLPSAE